MNQTKGSLPSWAAPLAILVLAALARAALLSRINLDADMAVTGLMGKHILLGHFPIFFYGQPFCGAIEAYVAAPIFALLGATPLTLSLAPTLLGMVFVLLCYLACQDMWGRRAGLWAMLFAALPPYLFALHNVLPRAAYIETPLFSLLLVWMAFHLAHRRATWWLYLFYGLVAGLGVWTHFLIAFALTGTALYLVLADWRLLLRRGHALIWLGFLVGSLPLWIYNLESHWQTLIYLAHLPAGDSALVTIKGFLGMAAPIVLGAFKDGTHQPMLPLLSYAAYALGLAALIYLIWIRRGGLWGLLRGRTAQADGSELFLLVLVLGVLITIIKGEPVGSTRRHYVPLYAAIIPLAGYALARLQDKRRAWALALAGLALVSNLAGLVYSSPVFNQALARDKQRQIDERHQAIERLLALGVTRAYSLDYWNCALITFESGERLVLVRPAMELDHFYEPQARLVAQSPQVVYLCRRDAQSVRQDLRTMGANYREIDLGSYVAFLDIRPPAPGFSQLASRDWRSTATANPQDTPLAYDQDALTRWSPLGPQRPGQTLEIDLGRVVPDVCLVRLNSGRVDDEPQCAGVYLSEDHEHWTRVTKLGPTEWPLFWSAGQARATLDSSRQDLGFSPHPARYVRLEQTCQTQVFYWSVQDMRIYRAGPEPPRADPPALIALARQLGAKRLYAEASLAGFVPPEWEPLAQEPPVSPLWPMDIAPHDVLPGDLRGVMVAVEAHDGPALSAFLEERGIRHAWQEAGGYRLVYNLEMPPRPALSVSLAGAQWRSSRPGGEGRAADANPGTAWDSGHPQQAGDFLQIELPQVHRLCGLYLDNRPAPQELPRALTVSLSDDGEHWREVPTRALGLAPLVFCGDRLMEARNGRLRLAFEPQEARWLRLSLPQDEPRQRWSVYELELEEAPGLAGR